MLSSRLARRLFVLVAPVVATTLVCGTANAADLGVTTVDISAFESPVWVDTTQDPETIQVWDVVENPVDVTPAHTATGISDSSSHSVANGDGGGGCYGWYYTPDKAYGARKSYKRRGTVFSYNNYSNSPGKVRIEKAQEVNVGVTLSASAEVEAGVIVSKVKATFGVSVTAGVKWTTSVSYENTVGAHRLGHLSGGAIGYTTKGRYYHMNSACKVDIDYPEIKAFTPSYKSYIYSDEAAVPVS